MTIDVDENEYKINLIKRIIDDFYEFGELEKSSAILDCINSIIDYTNRSKCVGEQKDD